VQSFALLDPYRSYRAEPVGGPAFQPEPAVRQADARTIFV
jgi:hypothetical protein